MIWFENLLIVIGASLEVFAYMECEGSMVRQVNKKQLVLLSVLGALHQIATICVGYLLTSLLLKKNPVSDEALMGEIVAIAIFLGLGTRLFLKSRRDQYVEEHLTNMVGRRIFLKFALPTCLYTLLSGIAFGLLHTGLALSLSLMGLVTILCVVAGTYTGYHYGFEQKGKAYLVGAVLFWAMGVDLIIRLAI